jgi:hypothetical protein
LKKRNSWHGGNTGLPAPKWFVIAKNEYRVTTSGIRQIRRYFPYLVTVLLALYVLYVAPAVAGLLIDDFIAFIISVAAVPVIQIILLMFFFYFVLFPISDTLREVKTGQIEVILASPVKPSDVLLGGFLGRMPIYAIAIVMITGTLTAILSPLGLDMIQNVVMISVFVITFLSAFWIGTVVAAVLRTKLARTAHGKDVGRALSIIIVLPMVGVMYALIGGGLIDALVNPATSSTVRTILSFLPSSWGAEIFVAFASSPGNITAVGFETTTRLAGLIVFFLATLWLGTKVANRAYSLESTAFTASRAKPDGLFYNTVRRLGGGGSFGILLVTSFKDYGRRLENLSYLFYSVILVVMITVFLSDPFSSSTQPLTMVSEMAIPMMTAFAVGTVSRGKDTLFLYKKSPNGTSRFVKAKLLQNWLVTIPLAAAIIGTLTFLAPQVTAFSLLGNVVAGSLRAMGAVILLLGLALLIPVFAEESRERMFGVIINLMLVLFITIGLELSFSRSNMNFGKILTYLDPVTVALCNNLAVTAIIACAGAVLLYLGKAKLSRIE